MKKIHMIAALLAMMLPITQVWATGTTYYAAIKANVSSSGGGKVYASTSDSETSSSYGDSTTATATGSSNVDGDSASITLYAFAKADYGYKLSGWSTTDGGTILSKSNVNPYSITITSSNTSSSPTPEQYYAVFEPNTSYVVSLVKPEVGVSSYTVTGPTGFSGSGLSNGGDMTAYAGESYSFSCAVAEGYEFVKWTVNGADAGTSTTLTKTFSSASTVQAVVSKLVTYYATCQAVPAGCSYKVGSTTVSGTEQQVSGYGTLSVTLSAPTAANGYLFAGWYMIENGNKTIFSTDNSTTVTRKSDVTLGADFVAITAPVMLMTTAGAVDYDDFDAAFAAAKSGDTLKVVGSGTLTATTAVAIGVTLEVASGVTLTVASGATLYIDGSVTVNGTISGTVSKCTKLVQQTGNNGEPYNPYDGDEKYQVKYWKTAITTPSISVSSSATHMTIVNGRGETVYRGATANAFVCTTDKSVAINHIRGVKASYSSATDAYNAVGKHSHNVSSTSCNLMGSAASELVLLTAAGSVNVGSSNPLNSGFIADCAGYNISFTSKQFANAVNVVVVNGATVSSSKLTNARLTVVNCATVKGAGTDGINNNQASYYTSVHVYDSGTPSSFNLAKSGVTLEVGTPGVCFFSGGPYSPNPAFGSYSNNYHVYGGSFSSNPTSYLATNDLEAPKEGNYWVVRRIVPTVNVAKVGSTEYESLQEAVNAAASSSGTVELLPGIAEVELDAPVTVASGTTVTIDLAGYAVTAPNGAIVNNGTLYLQDTSTFNVPGSITTASGNIIVNNGTMDVTYGKYTGNIQLNGGTFTTHFGEFVGTVSVASGLSPKIVANIRGGQFSRSMPELLRDGYSEVYYKVAPSDPMRYWVGQFPTPLVTQTSYSSAEKAWKLDFLSSSDLALYKKATARNAHSSLADWQRRAELYSSIQPWAAYVLDCGLVFDRAVTADSVTFYGKTQVSTSQSVDKDLAANEDFPALAHRIYEMGSTPYTYGRSIDEIGTITAGVKNNLTANVGTVCTVDLRVCTQQSASVYKKVKALIDIRYMLGGKKAAIDRGGSRLAYDSLSAAFAAVQDGETVLVGADSTDNVTLPARAGTYTIDPYGFDWTGTTTAASGFRIVSQTESTSLAVAQGVQSAKAITYVVESENAVTRIAVPTAVSGLVYDGTVQIGVAPGTGYTLSGNTATAAGTYTATATLADNYEWSDGTTDAKTITWSIGKAPLTITVADKTVVRGNAVTYTLSYDGFVGDEDESSLTTAATVTSAYDPAATDGAATYAITATGAASGNYAISYVPGTITVVPAVAKIGGTFYAALADALGSVTDANAATITLLADVSGDGIIVPSSRNITIDFGGFTCTMNGEPVAGSTGTETYAFQLQQDSTVKFMNGTIYSANASTLVQNYADLTLESMTLTLNNSGRNGVYTLSNNNGTTTIKDTTINANPTTGSVALGVRRYSSYPSVSVTVTGSSAINGDIKVCVDGNDVKEGATLMLDGGTVTGGIKMGAGAEFATVREKDAFNQAAPAGYAWVSDGENAGTSTLKKLYTVKFVDQHGNTYANGEFSLPSGTPAAEIEAKAATVAVVLPEGYIGYGWAPAFEAIVAADQTYAVVFTLGDKFICPVGDGGVKIARDWYDSYVRPNVENAPAVTDGTQPGSDALAGAAAALSTMAPNGVRYWQNYVLGLTGAADEKFTIRGAAPEIEEKTGDPTGNYVIIGELAVPTGWEATDVKVGTANAKSGYTVNANYKLVVRNADGTLSELEDVVPVPVTSAAPELLVPMDVAANKSLAIVIEITVEPAG